jgi:hypothetical protein
MTTGFTAVPAGCVAITSANATTYTSTSSDLGSYLTAQVGGTNTLGFGLAGAISTVSVGFPFDTTAPTVSGSAAVGSTWTLNTGTWTGTPLPTIVQAWLRCNAPIATAFTTVPAGCTAISGANGTTYLSTLSDVGKYLTTQLGGSNSMGFTLAGAVNGTAIQLAAPANTVAPTVSGPTTIGSTWTLNTGTWTGSPTPTIVQAWLRCTHPVTAAFTTVPAGCVAIGGATSTTYVTTTADAGKYLTAQLAGSNASGFALAGAMSGTAIQLAAPANTVAPTVSGSTSVGSTWTLNTGTWTGSPTPVIVQAWLRCATPVTTAFTTVPNGCVAIGGAGALTYVSTAGDVGKYLTAQVAGTNPFGFALSGAASTAVVQAAPPAAPANTVAPTVSGSTTVGSTWTVNIGTWTGSPTPVIVQAWLRCSHAVTVAFTTVPVGCVAINGATALTYVSAAADLGKYVTAQVAGTSSLGFALAGAITISAVHS